MQSIPDYVLSMDPGDTDKSWAYAVSSISSGKFEVYEAGFAPVLDNLSELNFTKHLSFLKKITREYDGTFDLVAERFIARGFAGKLAEYIPYSLGWYSALWDRGKVKLITSSQWKVKLKKANKDFAKVKGYDNWWESYFTYCVPEGFNKKFVHVQDSCAISLWYYKYWLKQNFIL